MYVVIIIVTVAVISVLSLYLRYKILSSYWKVRNVPYITPVPIFGNIFNICVGNISIGSLFYDIYKESDAPVQGFFVFHKPWLLIRDINLIKSIFVKDFDYFTDRATAYNPRDDEISSNTLFVLQNPEWRYVRNKMSPTMSPVRIKQLYPQIKDIGNELVSYINKKCAESNSIEIRTAAVKYVTDVQSLFSFGVDAQSLKQEDGEFFRAGRLVHSLNFLRGMQMNFYTLAPFLVKAFRMKLLHPRAAEFLRNAFWNIFREAENNSALGGDLIQYLIQLKKQNNTSEFIFDGDKLVAQSVQFFAAGLDTTSVTITYALYELSMNSDIQDRLREEISDVAADWKNLSYENINEMPYLDMVINETLRKYPAFPFIDRMCTKDYRLPGTDIVIPKGNPVCISYLGLHYDAKHFPDPYKFDPERFSKRNAGLRPTGCFIPFSIGPRVCIGERLALIAIKVALIQILRLYRIGHAKNSPTKFSANSLAMVPMEDIKLEFTKIEN